MSVVTLTTAKPQCQVFVTLSRALGTGETLTAVSGDTGIVAIQGTPVVSDTQAEVHFSAVGPAGQTTVVIAIVSGGVRIAYAALDVVVPQKIGAADPVGFASLNPVTHN